VRCFYPKHVPFFKKCVFGHLIWASKLKHDSYSIQHLQRETQIQLLLPKSFNHANAVSGEPSASASMSFVGRSKVISWIALKLQARLLESTES
jgi:hypothetical protein